MTFSIRTVGAHDHVMAKNTTRIAYLSTRLEGSSWSDLQRTVELAEDVDLDGLGLGDHVSFRVGAGADGLVGAASVLAASERLSAVIGVYLLPLRHPVVVARQVVDISKLAPGRLVLGVGIGGEDPHEFEICGVNPRTRGRRMDECLVVIRDLLHGQTVDFHGEFFHIENATIGSGTVEAVPILVGGRSDAAIRRAGRFGDGWFGIWVSASRYARAVEEMQEAATEAGREHVAWRNALNVWCGIDSHPSDGRRFVAAAMEDFYGVSYELFERWSPTGTPEHIAEFLAPYIEAGSDTINVIACGESLEAEISAVGEIRKHLR
jgi:alkanesulfonate monooxygenase SsuD/methylene tetrahydromethanopterin reductase-like flavin-dependent oxidoreductase (luciferase family)